MRPLSKLEQFKSRIVTVRLSAEAHLDPSGLAPIMVPPRTSIKIVSLDHNRDSLRRSVNDDQGIDDFGRLRVGMIFPYGQDQIRVPRVDGKVGVSVDARFCVSKVSISLAVPFIRAKAMRICR